MRLDDDPDRRQLDMSAAEAMPTMIMHRQRRRFLRSRKRFGVIPAGRRSGKTVEALHRLIWGSFHLGGCHHGCLTPPKGVADPTFVYAAPTHQQAKRIVWDKIKAAIPKWAIRKILETELSIVFITGAKLYVVGMDAPQRIEGIALDGVVLDEFADMKPSAWTSSIRPTLSTRGRPPGWALFIGRPRGKNHFWKLTEKAREKENVGSWDVFYTWPSWLVMDPDEIAAARRDLDERSFRQEYGGEFLSDSGRAYYQYGPWNNQECRYDPARPLLFSFDFNVSPGIAVVAQDMDLAYEVLACHRCGSPMPGTSGNRCRTCNGMLPFETVTAVIGEVWIEDGSNTRRVCLDLIEKWGDIHRGGVICYGDETGGSRKSSSERSDWQTIEDYLGRQWPNLQLDLPSVNPSERDRLVVTNSRLRNSMDVARVFVDKDKAPRLHEDLDETQLDDNGDLDEGPEKKRTHMCLVSGTLVATDRGDIPIEDIRPGMLVWTRKGLRPVTAQWCSGDNEPLFELVASNGSELAATGTHPVFTGCSWLPVQDLKAGMPLFPITSIERASSSTACGSIDTQDPPAGPTASTTPQRNQREKPASGDSTRKCGNLPMAPSRPGTTSTIAMATPPTTPSGTLSASLAQSTCGSTASNESRPGLTQGSATAPGPAQFGGTAQRQASSGIVGTGAPHGPTESLSMNAPAPSAQSDSSATSRPAASASSAAMPARPASEFCRESTTSPSPAPLAGPQLAETDTPRPGPAEGVVVLSCGNAKGLRGKVWDLTVDDAHEFFANGLLVSNSDGLGYLLHQRFGSPVNRAGKGLQASPM